MTVRLLNVACATMVSALLGTAALAQPTTEQLQMVYEASRNQLGVLEYCQTAGHIDGAAAEVQTRIMGMLPPPADTSTGEAAYASGKTGVVVAGGQTVTLADGAKAQSTTEKALCQSMASMVNAAAASLPPR